jgi:nitroreductase
VKQPRIRHTLNDFDLAAMRLRTAPGTNARDDRELIRCATLAASSHNTQPWRFQVTPDAIRVLPDFSRRCPVVDPIDAHLFKSLGCAAENIVQAAAAQGLTSDVHYDEADDAVVVRLSPSDTISSTELFEAIPIRQCTRQAFDGSPITVRDREKLERAGSGPGVRTVWVTDPATMASIATLVAHGDLVQLRDRAFRRELLRWIRFDATTALRRGDGLAGRCTGSPSVPTWLGRLVAPVAIRASAQADRDAQYIASSAGVVAFVAEHDDKSAWIDIGRAYQRFALQAAALGIRTAFINQPIEVPSILGPFETLLGLGGGHAELAIRIGHGDLVPYSLRRPIDAVIDTSPARPWTNREDERQEINP